MRTAREHDLLEAHELFDDRNLLTELYWQREYFTHGYTTKRESLFNLWIFDSVIKILEDQLKIGHWVSDNNGGYICSCGNENPTTWFETFSYDSIEFEGNAPFCPNCDAKMIKERS